MSFDLFFVRADGAYEKITTIDDEWARLEAAAGDPPRRSARDRLQLLLSSISVGYFARVASSRVGGKGRIGAGDTREAYYCGRHGWRA
jgi:hypothetical protein